MLRLAHWSLPSQQNLFRDHAERRRHTRHKAVTSAWLCLKDDTIPFVCVLWGVSEGSGPIGRSEQDCNPRRIYLNARTRRTERNVLSRHLRSREQIGIQFIDNASPISHLIKHRRIVAVMRRIRRSRCARRRRSTTEVRLSLTHRIPLLRDRATFGLPLALRENGQSN